MLNIDKHSNDIKQIIGIASGKGGTGKSLLTYLIANALEHHSLKIGILDADILNPSQHFLFNAESETMAANTDKHGNTIVFPVEKNNIKIASMGFVLNTNKSVALRGHRLSQIFLAFIQQII
jgi:ATP-binding protein involved in chromosome partitioning